tara:strand:+ start:509 stop:1519 length:1011 start_codon:yes stop_codon:yes gene_type:complete
MKNQLKIIAEIGVNHNGKFQLAKKLIDEAKKCGANAVKFQTFFAKNFVKKNTPKVKYQKANTDDKENHFKMIKKLELKKKDFIYLKKYCEKKNIEFISTPYDLESAEFLKSIKIKTFKTASADLSDYLLHKFISKTNSKVIISTGMANLEDINRTLKIYRNKKKIELLHCVSSYPCSFKSLNLKCINLLQEKFKIPVGFSDHSVGSNAAIIALALGARLFEKHFTLSKKMPGPDHKASMDPKEFKHYVNKIKLAHQMLGKPLKKIWPEELEMKKISSKSITFRHNLSKNSKIKISDIVMKRPGYGLNGFFIKKILGKKLKKDIFKDQQLKLKDFYL